MKKKLSVVVLVCIIFSLLYGCENPKSKYMPKHCADRENYVWVCKEPFAFMFLSETYSNESNEYFETYFEEEEGYLLSLASFTPHGDDGCFQKPYAADEKDLFFWGHADYHADYFDFTVTSDFINFFDEELPTLRFEKMTKEEFREVYGEERFSRITADGEVDGI